MDSVHANLLLRGADVAEEAATGRGRLLHLRKQADSRGEASNSLSVSYAAILYLLCNTAYVLSRSRKVINFTSGPFTS